MAKAKQLIISVEDRPGSIATAIKSLAAAKINILSILGWNPSVDHRQSTSSKEGAGGGASLLHGGRCRNG